MSLPAQLPPKAKPRAAVGYSRVVKLVTEHFIIVGHVRISSLTVSESERAASLLTVTDGVVFFACPCLRDRDTPGRPSQAYTHLVNCRELHSLTQHFGTKSHQRCKDRSSMCSDLKSVHKRLLCSGTLLFVLPLHRRDQYVICLVKSGITSDSLKSISFVWGCRSCGAHFFGFYRCRQHRCCFPGHRDCSSSCSSD